MYVTCKGGVFLKHTKWKDIAFFLLESRFAPKGRTLIGYYYIQGENRRRVLNDVLYVINVSEDQMENWLVYDPAVEPDEVKHKLIPLKKVEWKAVKL